MNYAYIFVDNLNGHSYENGISELKASISTLKNKQSYTTVQVFNNEISGKNIEYFKMENIIHNNINLSKNYGKSDKINPINILVEKIIQLMNFDENQDIVLMDVDTSSQKTIPEDFFDSNYIVFDTVEYPIMQWRNLDRVLPQIPWKDFDINFDDSFMMYNTGVIYIPKKFRKEICEKALKIVDYLNGNFDPVERCGNKLDEQIALSIVCHDTYGRFGNIKYSSEYIHHHWEDRQNGIEWWKCHLKSDFNHIEPEFPDEFYDEVFHNYPKILDFFTPSSYLDVGTCKGHAVPFIIKKLPSLTKIEMIEACEDHKEDLKSLSERMKIPYHIEVLSDEIKKVTFYSMKDPDKCHTQPGNSYYKENTPHYLNCEETIRTTNTLDNIYKNQHFDLIKLDTQGSELDILKGGKNMIKNTKGLILEETVENYHNFNFGSPKDIECKEYLKRNDFIFIEYFHDYEHSIQDSDFNWVQHRQHDSFYVKKDLLKLPISIGILSWKSNKTLRNTLNSYKQNGLFDIVDNVVLFFQEISDEDRDLAKEYNIPFISDDKNIGIGNAFIKLAEVSKENYILLLEHDWELTKDIKTTFLELKRCIELLNNGYNCVRLRNVKKPGNPLYSQNAYQGNELNHYDSIIDLTSPHLFECRHWIENIEEVFPDKIKKENDYFATTSRWSNFTNNPCLYDKNFYVDAVYPFKGKGQHLENDISYWWARQNFKIAWGEGLFTHNDIQKHEVTQNVSYLSDKKQNTISFIFAHRDTDKWSTPLSIVNEFKRLGWKTEIYSLFDSNDNYTDDNIHKLLNTNPDIIMHMDWGQHTSPILDELRKTGAYCIMESGDDPQKFNNNSIKSPWFDLILSPDIRSVEEYRNRGYNSEWWTHFTDTECYFPLEVKPTQVAVCSRGMGNGAYIIDNLVQKYPDKVTNKNGFYGSDHNEFLNSGIIILQQSRYGEITRRIFEGMSCKKLVLADMLDASTKIQDLFVDGEDIVFYDNEEDCLNKIVYYCNNQEEAKRIAENGYNKVLNNHTQKQRVEFIINKWKSVIK